MSAGAVPTAPALFQPDGLALYDPKAYFAQWQQASHQCGQAVVPVLQSPAAPSATAAAGVAASSEVGERNEVLEQVQNASAVRCAAIVKEKGHNFTAAVAIQALRTLATKSSFKLREELLRQPHVRKLCERVQDLVRKAPPSLNFEALATAAWSLTRFPEEVRGEAVATFGGTARRLATIQGTEWAADAASKVLWSLAKADVISQHKQVVSQVVQELVRDQGRRVAELSHEGLFNLLWAVARARRHMREGDHQTVHCEANDELLFSYAAKRVAAEVDQIDARLLADLAHAHAEIGIRDEALFKAICPRIVAKQKELDEHTMARVIQAYRRFMIPLKEEAQGFRTMAVVQKGDFIRPSDKPKKQGKRTYDHPQALYPKTPVHARG